MATTFLFLLLSAIFIAKAQRGQSVVNPGSFLTPTTTTTTNSSWPSPSGRYAFGFYKQGSGYAVGVFFAGIPDKTVAWTANRDDPPVSAAVTLNFTSDGRLVLQLAHGTTKRVAVYGETASSASMLDTGNFVVYNADNQTIWESFQNPTDTLLPTQRLLYDDVLDSSVSESNQSTGRFRAIMQQDGFIALYPIGTPYYIEYGYWSKGIQGPPLNATLNLDVDGHLYLANGNGIVTISAGGNSTKGLLYRLRMDDDGFLRLYSYNTNRKGDWVVTWSADSIGKCDPKGLCGVNAFCVIYDEEYNCTCLPGFAFVDESKRTLGCERNLTVDNCKEGTYDMEEEINTDCKIACLQDCNCEAALFKDGACRKQRLPMRFGRRQSDSSVALIKVSTSAPSTNRTMTKERKKELRVDILIVTITLVAFAFIVLVISGFVIYRSHVSKHVNVSNMGKFVDEDVGPRSFTYAKLEKITDGFKEELGRGAFGIVYKGMIGNGQKIVAVKRLEKLLANREREFQTEMKVIGKTHRRNLIRLLGYCHDGLNRLLVYEYMCNGSLADILFTPKKQPSWDERRGITCNIARRILYLHEECIPQIIHCDIKPQNILMDENRCAKLFDFGLAKLLKLDQSQMSTNIRGTRGCCTRVASSKLSFLLEIIFCRKSVDSNLPEEEAILEEWVHSCFECGELDKLIYDEEVDKRHLERMVKVAFWCILEEPSLRPSMKKVLLMLEGIADIPIPPNPTSVIIMI
ncbi:hypothetical protein ACJW30_04G029300 [Castanea mollissima]